MRRLRAKTSVWGRVSSRDRTRLSNCRVLVRRNEDAQLERTFSSSSLHTKLSARREHTCKEHDICFCTSIVIVVLDKVSSVFTSCRLKVWRAKLSGGRLKGQRKCHIFFLHCQINKKIPRTGYFSKGPTMCVVIPNQRLLSRDSKDCNGIDINYKLKSLSIVLLIEHTRSCSHQLHVKHGWHVRQSNRSYLRCIFLKPRRKLFQKSTPNVSSFSDLLISLFVLRYLAHYSQPDH